MITFYRLPFTYPIDVGYLPEFFNERDPRPAREQIHENYAHGGGWRPYQGFTVGPDRLTLLSSEGDPPMKALATAMLRNEMLIVYEYEWLAIYQPDGSVEIARVN